MPKLVDHDERRRHLLAALWRIVERDGAAAISIRNVAIEAGVSKSAIAHYFPNRLALLEAAVTQINAEANRRLARLDFDDGQIDTAVNAVMVGIPDSRARRKQSEVWVLLISERSTDPAVRELAASLDQMVRDAARDAVVRWQTTGLIHPDRDADVEAARLHALMDGLALHTLHDPVGLPPGRLRVLVRAHLSELAQRPTALTV